MMKKMKLFQLILQVFQSKVAVSRIRKRETSIVIVGGKAFNLTENDGKVDVQEIHKLTSSQEETDTRVVLYLKYGAQKGSNSAVVRTLIQRPFSFYCITQHLLA